LRSGKNRKGLCIKAGDVVTPDGYVILHRRDEMGVDRLEDGRWTHNTQNDCRGRLGEARDI
jgi:hypothetical protein